MKSDNVSAVSGLRRSAVRYWEVRRIVYLLLLVPPALIFYFLASEPASDFASDRSLWDVETVILFGTCFIGANICYSFAYVIEFFYMGSRNYQKYLSLRPVIYGIGCLLGMWFAANMALNIGVGFYYPRS